MDLALVVGALMLGLAGAPHCLAMCAAPCAAAVGGAGTAGQLAFHGLRLAGYALAGALAAASVGTLAALGQASPVFKPLWSLLHLAALALGLWLAVTGRQPAWLESIGRGPHRRTGNAAAWQPLRGPVAQAARPALAGAAWVAWPCGLLQSALVVSALANTPAAGAAVMATFGAATASALVFGPWLWRRLQPAGATLGAATLGVRFAGAMLALASGWALGHHAWADVVAYCFG